MPPLKLWQLSALIFQAYFYGFTTSVEFEPCFPAVKDQPCNMTCRVQNLLETVDFYCNGTSRGACVPGVFCNPNIEIEGVNTLYFKIPSLSYASDNCDWTCLYGAVSSSVSNPTIFSGFSSSLILTNQTNEDKIDLTATAECVYPSNTTVRVQYREEQDTSGKYQYLTQQVDVQGFHIPGNCSSDIEKRIVAKYEVSRKHSLLGEKSVFLRMEFIQYLSATPSYTNDVGPFTFNKSSSSEENESSNLGLVLGLGFGLGIPGGAVVISLVFFIYHKKKSSSKPTKPSVNVKLITQTTAEFTVTFKPNAPPPTKLKVIVTAQTKRTKYYNVEVENGAPKPVTVELEDLTPSTSYMFEFAGENDAGEGPARTVSKNTQAFDVEDGDHGKGLSLDSCFRKCKVKPENEMRSQNNTGSNTNRTATGRVGSPASTSNVEFEANLNRNKTDVPKGDQSALNQKAWQSPLPLPPVASQPPTASTHNLPLSRNNQLGPIAVENEEANSSEKKKKKKKKKKKRIVDEAEDNENES